jgi:hypothetical protein
MLPATILGASIAHYYMIVELTNLNETDSILNNFLRGFSLVQIVDQIVVVFIGNMTFGACIVFISSYIAPSHKIQTALAFSALIFLFSGALLVIAIASEDYWTILAISTMNLSSIGVTIGMIKDKIKSNREEEFIKTLLENKDDKNRSNSF